MLKTLMIVVGFMLFGVGNAAAQNDGRTLFAVFPMFANGHFADGSYYRSTLMSSNPSLTAPSSCTTTAWVNGFSGAGTNTYSANEWNIDPTPGSGPLVTGYLTISCSQAINANLLYSYYSSTDQKLAEATVFPSPIATTLQLLADQTEGARLGIAVVNDKAFAQTVTIMVGDTTGAMVVNSSVQLGPHQTLTKFLDELASKPIGQGQVLISCPSGCGAVGLRYTGSVFTTIPASVRVP